MTKVELRGRLFDAFDKMQARLKEREERLSEYRADFAKYNTLFLYGAGTDAAVIAEDLKDILPGKNVCFIDGNKTKHEKEIVPGIFCHAPEKMYGMGDKAMIVITSSQYADEIEYNLLREKNRTKRLLGTPVCAEYALMLARNKELAAHLSLKDKMVAFFDSCDDELTLENILQGCKRALRGMSFRPFDLDNFRLSDENILPDLIKNHVQEKGAFILCRAFSGDMVKNIAEDAADKYAKMYVFEANRLYIDNELKEIVPRRAEIINAVLGERDFHADESERGQGVGAMNAWLDNTSDGELDVMSLDTLAASGKVPEKVTFVRLNIGNATFSAIRGMEQVIKRDKPLLSINPGGHIFALTKETMWYMKEYLSRIVPEYKFMLRSHEERGNDSGGSFYAYV